MDSARKHPSYRLHWLTWLVTGLVLLALVNRQFEKQHILGISNLEVLTNCWILGWPLAHLEVIESFSMVVSPAAPSGKAVVETEFEWFSWQLMGSSMVGILLVGSTAFVCEIWLRSERRRQFSLRQLLVATAVLGILLAFTREWELPSRGNESFPQAWSLISWSDTANPSHWPVLWALCCTIDSSGWLTLSLLHRGTG